MLLVTGNGFDVLVGRVSFVNFGDGLGLITKLDDIYEDGTDISYLWFANRMRMNFDARGLNGVGDYVGSAIFVDNGGIDFVICIFEASARGGFLTSVDFGTIVLVLMDEGLGLGLGTYANFNVFYAMFGRMVVAFFGGLDVSGIRLE